MSGFFLYTDDIATETQSGSSTVNFVDALIHSLESDGESDSISSDSESDSISSDGDFYLASDTADFVEDLMHSMEAEIESDSDMLDFVQQLVHSFEPETDTDDTSDIDDYTDHGSDLFTPYVDEDSASEEEMDFPQPLYDNAPLSDSASRQAIMQYALANHLSYAAVDQLLTLLKIHLPSPSGSPKNSSSLRRRFVEGIPLQQCYCPHCFTKLDDGTNSCRNRECREMEGGTCYFVPVDITPHLKEIFSGKCLINYYS